MKEDYVGAFITTLLTFGVICVVVAGLSWSLLNYRDKHVWKKKYELEKAALELQTERVMFYEQLLERVFGTIPRRTFSTSVTVTAYSAREEETNSEPWFTADMSLSRIGILAVSRDILEELGIEYGDTVLLGGIGVFRVHDTMNKRWKRRVDILMAHPKAAKKFGKQEAMLTWIGGQK